MTAQSKSTIKGYFETGDTPTESQFIDLIDSYQDVDASLTSIASAWTAASASGPASLAFAEDTDNGSHAITLTAPVSVTADVTITLPGTAGTVMLNVVEDTTPQLGGNLDLNGSTVGDASASDLTKLSEITATSTELNYVDGVTSDIQTQIDSKIEGIADLDIQNLTARTAFASGDKLLIWEAGVGNRQIDYDDLPSGAAAITTGAVTPTTADIDFTGSTDGHVLTIQADGSVAFEALPAAGGALSEVVEDTTPQLGGNLDLNSFNIGDASEGDLLKLSSITASSGELNYVAGVTSAIQTQLDAKAALTDLASTANGDGAALIGVEDSAGDWTATTVEGVLAEIGTSLAATLTDLASTANGDGASMIGVEDIAGDWTATTVEGVLAEIGTGLGAAGALGLSMNDGDFAQYNESSARFDGVPSAAATGLTVAQVMAPGSSDYLPLTKDLNEALAEQTVTDATGDITLTSADGFRPTIELTGGTSYTVLQESWDALEDGLALIFKVEITSGDISFEATTPAYTDISDGAYSSLYNAAGAVLLFKMIKMGSALYLDVKPAVDPS